MALNFARKKGAKKSDDLTRDRMVEIYTSMLADLTKEVKDAIDKGRELISRGAPAELLVASMAEQYPMMAMYAEEMVLTKQGLTREQVLAAVEKFEKDEELDKLLGDITSLSDMFNILKEENIEARPLPEHVTKELVLAIAKENADMTIKVIQATSAKQKAEKLSDEQAAELAEKEAQASQMANFEKHDLTQDIMTAAILKFSTEDESFGEKMQEVSAQLSASMHELRAAELGMTPEQLALQNEIQMAARALAEQGMSQEEISKVLAASLQMREEDIAKSETESKKKNKKKNKKNKKAGKSDDKEVAEDDAGDDDESEAAAPAAETKWNDVE
jgi:hypothetical protein